MDKNIKIAGKMTIKDWEKFRMKLDYKNDANWDLAYSLFYKRIKLRYLNPIQAIVDLDFKNGEGFAIVSLQCSLIETIECFFDGWIYDFATNGAKKYNKILGVEKNNNEGIFRNFFETRIPFKNVKIDGVEFYRQVRCALLHETQTKSSWKIISKKEKPFYYEQDGLYIINRNEFQKAIEKVIKQYKQNILFGPDKENLRKYFIEKIDNICKIS
ncbi:MAG: hypothetical protein WKF88_01880 [Ferruginibacter sp.]